MQEIKFFLFHYCTTYEGSNLYKQVVWWRRLKWNAWNSFQWIIAYFLIELTFLLSWLPAHVARKNLLSQFSFHLNLHTWHPQMSAVFDSNFQLSEMPPRFYCRQEVFLLLLLTRLEQIASIEVMACLSSSICLSHCKVLLKLTVLKRWDT